MQNSGPWDPWLPVVKNSRLFAQRTVRPPSIAYGVVGALLPGEGLIAVQAKAQLAALRKSNCLNVDFHGSLLKAPIKDPSFVHCTGCDLKEPYCKSVQLLIFTS